jgi:hypothetical protein
MGHGLVVFTLSWIPRPTWLGVSRQDTRGDDGDEGDEGDEGEERDAKEE